MNADPVVIAIAAVMVAVFALCLVFFFVHVRLWVQAHLTNTPVSLLDIIGMRLRRCPPTLIVHAMIVLHQRGVKLSARDAEGYYRTALETGESVATATELANLVEEAKRKTPDHPPS